MTSLALKPLRTLALLATIAALTACGVRGGLDKPPPRFGEAHRKYVAEQKAAAEAKEKSRQTVTIPTTSPAPEPAPPPTTNLGDELSPPTTPATPK